MCGRFSLTATPEEVAELFGLSELEAFPPRYNIAPTQPILAIRASLNQTGNDTREAVLVRWGLIPSWVKDPADFTLLVNARSETAAEKPSFRNALRRRRVLIPASGFYEWKRFADKKQPSQPYWIRPEGGGIVAFGGLMETWHGKDGSEIDTGLVLTTNANARISDIHDRMPVVITQENYARWLDCVNYEPKDIADLLAPAHDDLFETIPVSDKVNKVANVGPDLQERVGPAAKAVEPSPKPKKAAGGGGQGSLF